jgi:hypothetical protein
MKQLLILGLVALRLLGPAAIAWGGEEGRQRLGLHHRQAKGSRL